MIDIWVAQIKISFFRLFTDWWGGWMSPVASETTRRRWMKVRWMKCGKMSLADGFWHQHHHHHPCDTIQDWQHQTTSHFLNCIKSRKLFLCCNHCQVSTIINMKLDTFSKYFFVIWFFMYFKTDVDTEHCQLVINFQTILLLWER